MTEPPADVDALLRAALDTEAGRVEVAPDALGAIRTRIMARRARWPLPSRSRRPARPPHPRGGLMLAMGSGVAAAIVAVAVGIGSCAPPPATHSPSGGPTTATPSRSPTSVTVNLPIYYAGTASGPPRLYREYHRTTVNGDTPLSRIAAALELTLHGGTAYDRDYGSQWPAGTRVGMIQVADDVAEIDLDGATANPGDPAGNGAALQQLVWTVTAVGGVTGVRLLFDGNPRTVLWPGRLPVARVLHRAPAVDTLAPVWVIDPQQDSISGGDVTVHLAGIVFEGAVQLRIRDSAGTVVRQRAVQLSVGSPAQGTATVQLTLPPGAYTVEAYFVSLKDSSVQGIDDHGFTVR